MVDKRSFLKDQFLGILCSVFNESLSFLSILLGNRVANEIRLVGFICIKTIYAVGID